MRSKLVFFITFSLLGTKNWCILSWTLILKYYLYKKYFKLEKNYTKSEQISRVHTKLQSSIKTKIKKIFLILNSTLDQLFNDTTHISLRQIYQSAKIDWTKKNKTSGVGTIKKVIIDKLNQN